MILIFFIVFTYSYGVDEKLCKHFLLRTSFAVMQNELAQCQNAKNYEQFVINFVTKTHKNIHHQNVDLNIVHNVKIKQSKTADEKIKARKEFRSGLRNENFKLQSWWFEQMLASITPFKEKIVLFWHNHFATSSKKVRQSKLLYEQNLQFREYGLGNFKDLLHQIIRDPAMLIYLDNSKSKKTQPNENLAREMLELFTLGEGHYSEEDIKEFSKALTGYSTDKNYKFKFKKKLHDTGQKTFLGKRGNFNGDDIIEIILQDKQTAVFITEKLYKEFVNYEVDKKEVTRLANIFRTNNYDISKLMIALFTSKEFTDPKNFSTMIKSPVELVIGSLRALEIKEFDTKTGIKSLDRIGQSLFAPPNVKGWKGGYSWINANTLLRRKGFLYKLSRSDEILNLKQNNIELQNQLLPSEINKLSIKNKKSFVRVLLQSPLYQLK